MAFLYELKLFGCINDFWLISIVNAAVKFCNRNTTEKARVAPAHKRLARKASAAHEPRHIDRAARGAPAHSPGPRGYAPFGTSTRNTDPWPTALSTEIVPPTMSRIRLTNDIPRPLPSEAWDLSPW